MSKEQYGDLKFLDSQSSQKKKYVYPQFKKKLISMIACSIPMRTFDWL